MAPQREEIFEALKEHLVGRGVDANDISPEAHLANDLKLDSLDLAEMTVGLEDRFGIEIPDEELEDVTTVQDAIDLITGKVAVST
jgi:acyl carrier protein